MGRSPSNWGNTEIPVSKIENNIITPIPYFVAESQTFSDKTNIELVSAIGGDIYYSINGNKETKYTSFITINKDSEIKCRTLKDSKWSKYISANYYKIDNTKTIKLYSEYANQYAAAGDKTLIDHLRGGENYRTGNWQGYREDLNVTVNLGEIKEISSISIGFLQDIKSWIFFPTKIEILTSEYGDTYNHLVFLDNTFPDDKEGTFTNDFTFNKHKINARYVQIKAINYGVCPKWHLGAGGKTWLFVDELIIK